MNMGTSYSRALGLVGRKKAPTNEELEKARLLKESRAYDHLELSCPHCNVRKKPYTFRKLRIHLRKSHRHSELRALEVTIEQCRNSLEGPSHQPTLTVPVE